jgi:hypothetical protein
MLYSTTHPMKRLYAPISGKNLWPKLLVLLIMLILTAMA